MMAAHVVFEHDAHKDKTIIIIIIMLKTNNKLPRDRKSVK